MGQAKRRGTFEERFKKAIERDAIFEKDAADFAAHPISIAPSTKHHRIHRQSTMAAMSAIIALATLPPKK